MNTHQVLILLLFVTFSVQSQEKKDSVILENQSSTKVLNLKSNTKKVEAPEKLNLNTNAKVNTETIDNFLNKYKPKTTSNMLLEERPEDKDIVGRKYWKGKDVTHQQLKSNYSLGTVTSNTQVVKVECRDHSYIDGDRIRIYLNQKPVSNNIGLKANYYVLYLTLEKGYNRIDFQALNQGFSGPNTAEVIVYDQNGVIISSKEWNISTGETATLGVIKN